MNWPKILKNPLIVAVVSVLITAIAAQWHFRTQVTVEDQRSARNDWAAISTLMDRRVWQMRRVIWSIKDRQPWQKRVSLWTEYRDGSLTEWNTRLNSNKAIVCRNFGQRAAGSFERDIADKFRLLHDHLRRHVTKPLPPTSDATVLDSEMATLEKSIKELNTFVVSTSPPSSVFALSKPPAC